MFERPMIPKNAIPRLGFETKPKSQQTESGITRTLMLMEHRLYITRMETLIPNGNYEDHADHVLIYKNTNAYYKNQRKTNI